MDRTLITVALCTMVLLAGCGGGGTATPGAATTEGAPGGPTVPALSPGTADVEYDFSAGDTWEYDVLQLGANRELTLEVTAINDGEVVLSQTFVEDNETQESTYSGPPAELLRNASPTLATLHLPQVLVAGHELSVGNSWTAESNASIDVTFFGTTETIDYGVEGQTVEVTGTDSYAGIECYTVEFTSVTADGELDREACVRPDGGFALYLNATTPEGSVISEWELTDRSR